jgi:HTH-type transcriptional regulator, competence development regulator
VNFGQYIKMLRADNRLSLEDLANVSGTSSTEIFRIESGERKNPSYVVLKAISPHLNIAYEELLQKAGYIDSLEETEKFTDNEIDNGNVNMFLGKAKAAYEKDKEWAKLALEVLESGLSEEELELFKVLNTNLLNHLLKIKKSSVL